MNDAELVQQVINGNENAFRFLVAKHQRLVLHIVGRIVRRQEDWEDICQDVFMKVFRKIRKFRGDSKLSTWIATIAYNTSLSYIRSRNRKQELFVDEDIQSVAGKGIDRRGQKTLEKEEVKQLLLEMIETLPVHYRTVLTLFHLEEFSYKEVGEITGMPEGTIKSYLSRARKMLKERLEQVSKSEKTNIFTEYAEG